MSELNTMTIPMPLDTTPELPVTLDMELNVVSGAVNSVNGMTGDVVLGASDVGALPDDTVIPSKTSDLENDSGFLTAIPSEYVTDTELQTAISGKADSADLATVATSGSYNDLLNKPTIPTKTSDLQNDSGFITSVPVESVNSKTGAVTLTASDVGALPDTYTAPVTSVNGATGAVVIGNATTSSAGLMSATDKSNLDTLVADYSSALTALGVI